MWPSSLFYMCVGSAANCLGWTHPLGSATTAKDVVGTKRRIASQPRSKRLTKVCMRDALLSPHVHVRQNLVISGIKRSKKSKEHHCCQLGIWMREAVWTATTSVLSVLCVKEVSLQPVVFLPSLLSRGFDPWAPRAMLGWLCLGVPASRVASTACDLEVHGCSWELWSSCLLPSWLCAVFGVQLRACSTPRQDAYGEP